jgi:hypothetical protein
LGEARRKGGKKGKKERKGKERKRASEQGMGRRRRRSKCMSLYTATEINTSKNALT